MSASKAGLGWVVFLGPSLSWDEARRWVPAARLCAPARRGDVFRALALQPLGIALIDGVFEAQPSVWHRELLAALDAGVRVLGASSMGALRAAELERFGMEGVGEIARAYSARGPLVDDADVALLHADAEHGFRPLTLPLVNARHGIEHARKEKVLTPAQARALLAAASAQHYSIRTWRSVVDAGGPDWSPRTRTRWEALVREGLPDLKAEDARACLQVVAKDVGAVRDPRTQRLSPEPSHVRHRRLFEGITGGVENIAVLERLRARPDAKAMAFEGARRLVLAALGRSLGLTVSEEEVEICAQEFLARHRTSPRDRLGLYARLGLDAGSARRLCEDLALENKVLVLAQRVLPDGPSLEEGMASEARLNGAWATAAQEEHAAQKPEGT